MNASIRERCVLGGEKEGEERKKGGERGRERERERESSSERETWIGCIPHILTRVSNPQPSYLPEQELNPQPFNA